MTETGVDGGFVPDGHTIPFAVIGHPIGHTLSPAMHNAAFRALGMNAVYLAFDVSPDRAVAALRSMGDLGFRGVNVTVPLKETVFRGLERLDDSARLVGSVNTVRFGPEGLTGYSTDGTGFLRAVREDLSFEPSGRAVFVLGAGGAGRVVALECARGGAASVVLADVDAARAERVTAEVRLVAPAVRVTAIPAAAEQASAVAREADLVVQATPVGMKTDDPSPLPPAAFRPGSAAFDLVYMHPETGFLRAAREGGARTANGLGMLLHQGARAFELWNGVLPPVRVMRDVLERAVYGTTA